MAARQATIVIPCPLPGLNELIDLAAGIKHPGKKKRFTPYQEVKKKWARDIEVLARVQRFEVAGPHWHYEFREPNRRRDPSNIIAGGVKLIEDALQEAGLLENDGWAQVQSITLSWRVDKSNPGVTVTTTGEDDERAEQ